MAKKDRLKNLLGAFTEAPVQEQQESNGANPSADQDTRISPELVNELGISPEMEEKLNQVRKERAGRPLGRKPGNPKPRENRATFIVDKETIRKLKYISLMDTKLYKDVISEALQSYITEWEDKNGVINLPNK